ncbi:hypothetical protein [Lacrimispora defluvii]|uniref:Uncharacterized protein n=1 Tax=Lacrimispora defluvii TaxID=2719233 RepID=A0ABX1VT53_9FIRM|nr:hypothetical protein [Lacrimispora defluvii]NNJ30590.1 hypothetical protein [Lacrimispora defluvii]
MPVSVPCQLQKIQKPERIFGCRLAGRKEGLDKQASAQAIYTYTLNAAIEFIKILGEKDLTGEGGKE